LASNKLGEKKHLAAELFNWKSVAATCNDCNLEQPSAMIVAQQQPRNLPSLDHRSADAFLSILRPCFLGLERYLQYRRSSVEEKAKK